MKKTIVLFLIFALAISCSSEDNTNPEDGFMRVLYLSEGAAPGQQTVYQITYGTRINDDQVTTQVNQDVYQYYLQKFNDALPGKPRWRGMITQD